MMLKIAVGTDLGEAKTKTVDWDKFAERLCQHEQSSRKGGKFFVGGYFSGTERKEANLVERTMLTLDADEVGMSLEALELELMMSLDCAFVAYSTYSHTSEKPRIRIVVPLSKGVTSAQYRILSDVVGKQLGIPLDACSYKPNQVMYMPSCPDITEAWSLKQDGEPLDVETVVEIKGVPESSSDALDDLEAMLKAEPLDISDDEVDAWLEAGPAEGQDYDAWFMRGAALHHQYRGSKQGYDKWVAWSEKSSKHDPSLMKTKWKSCGRSSRVVTFASVIYAVKEAGGLATLPAVTENTAGKTKLDELLEEAAAVASIDEYNDLKRRVQSIPGALLGDDYRAMIAAELAKGFGKTHGIAKGDIKKALTPNKRKRNEGDVETPDWLLDWVYCESTMEFINVELDYAIKREAFNAKYDRMPDCVMSEMSAAQYALQVVQIETVVDTMFFPGAAQMFEHDGKLMLNQYRDRGAPAIEPQDSSTVVDRFLKHLEWTVVDEGDREILLDWLCFVCQNPGLRINWALLLQGAQGTGKTYLVNLLQAVLGSNVASLDPQAIAGRFTGWAHGSTVCAIEEIRIHGTNKYEILDRMKPFLTNAVVAIEEKGRDHRTVPNFTSYLLLTNHPDAIPLMEGDRRYCVLYSRWQSEGQMYNDLGGRLGAEKYFDALFDDLHESRVGELAWFLKCRQISPGFSARGRAPETTARQRMINLAISPERELLEDAISQHECAIINGDVIDITYLNMLCQMEGTELPKTRSISAILLDMGYVQYEKRFVKITKNRKNHYVWLGRNVDASIATQTIRDFHNDPDFIPF